MPEFLRALFHPASANKHREAAIEVDRRQADIAERLARLRGEGAVVQSARPHDASGGYRGQR